MPQGTRPAEPGDLVEITGHRLGDHPRLGEILEVRGAAGSRHYVVRWEDGRQSIFFPGADAIVRRAATHDER